VGIEFEVEDDENFGSVQGEIVSIADETKDDVLDELQVLYDELQEELEQILEQNGDGLMMNAAGMQTQLKDGTMCTLRVEPTICQNPPLTQMTPSQDIHSLFSPVFLQKCPESGSSTLRAILSIKACNSSNSNTVRIRVTIVGSTLRVHIVPSLSWVCL
jgi:hypothetical protein